MTWIALLFAFAAKIGDFANICKDTGMDFRHPRFHSDRNVSTTTLSKHHEMRDLLTKLRNVDVGEETRLHLIYANNHLFDAEVRGFRMGNMMENWYYENRGF